MNNARQKHSRSLRQKNGEGFKDQGIQASLLRGTLYCDIGIYTIYQNRQDCKHNIQQRTKDHRRISDGKRLERDIERLHLNNIITI